jgi:hypothetical protein
MIFHNMSVFSPQNLELVFWQQAGHVRTGGSVQHVGEPRNGAIGPTFSVVDYKAIVIALKSKFFANLYNSKQRLAPTPTQLEQRYSV